MATPRSWVDKVKNMPLPRRVRVMNLCGDHERSITMAGLRGTLPLGLELISGPGCPVCVCPEEDVYLAIRIALSGEATVVTSSHMLRLPANAPPNEPRTLEQARAAGGEVETVASPRDAWRLATEHPGRALVYFAAGFETTMAPLAARIVQGLPRNLHLLLSGRLTRPAVAMLLERDDPGFDALLAPGHVSTVMGPEEWGFVVEKHGIPTAIAGFETRDILVALHSVLRQVRDEDAHLDNCYGRAVRAGGNPLARRLMDEVFLVVDAPWRGIGIIPESGLQLAPAWQSHDARTHYGHLANDQRERAGEMPPGSQCANVVLGRLYPDRCPLYAKTCDPKTPAGPCMVADEGPCRIWWASGVRVPAVDAEPTEA